MTKKWQHQRAETHVGVAAVRDAAD